MKVAEDNGVWTSSRRRCHFDRRRSMIIGQRRPEGYPLGVFFITSKGGGKEKKIYHNKQ